MKTSLVFVSCVLAVVLGDFIPVLSRSEVRDEHGQFALSYQSGDGTVFSEQGELKPTNDHSDYVLVKKGSVAYTSPEGKPISFSYIADEYGFRPAGDHLPVA